METSIHSRFLRRRKLFRTIFGVFSLSGIMFAFQACYGTPQDSGLDVLIKGTVSSAAGKIPVPGIRVGVSQIGQYTQSAADGTYSMYCEKLSQYRLTFSDTDGNLNGQYQELDTLVQLPDKADKLTVDILLK